MENGHEMVREHQEEYHLWTASLALLRQTG